MCDADRGPSEIADEKLGTDLVAERDRIDRTMADLVRSREVLDAAIEVARRR